MKAVAAKPSKGELTRQSILDIAERQFGDRGYEATRLEEVGDAVGIRRAAIFYYFRSKQELFEAVVADIHESLIRLTEERLAGAADPWERLMLLAETWLDYMIARPTAARLILRNCADAGAETCSRSSSRHPLELLRDIIDEGIAVGRFHARDSGHLVNLMSGAILHYVCNPEQADAVPRYTPDDPSEVATFKTVLRKTARAIVDPR